MKTTTKTLIWLLTGGAFFAFFVFGFTDNLKGPTLPALLQDLQLNYAIGGTILMGIYLGFMAASLISGFLADALGEKIVLVNAGICLALGVVGFTLSSSPVLLTICMIFLGFGMGSLELGCNSLIVLLLTKNTGRYLNLMAVMHGLGSMLAPLFAGWLLMQGSSWRAVYRWDLILVAILIMFFLTARFPLRDETGSKKTIFSQIGSTAFSSTMLVYYFAQMIYVAIEMGISSWMVEFLQKAHSQSVGQSTQALSIFFALVMIGRLIGSFFVEKLGYLRSVLFAALASSTCVAASLFGPARWAWLLPVSGLFLSIIFPTITASVTNTNKENTSIILGLLFTSAGFGGILGPWLVGFASDLGGIQFGFSLNLLFGILTALSALVLLRHFSHHAKDSSSTGNPG